MSISRSLRQETLVEHLLGLSLQEIGLEVDDLTAAHRKEVSGGIAADLNRFRHSEHAHHQGSSSNNSAMFPSDRKKEAKIQRLTLVKKWAALIQHQLPSRESLLSQRQRSATAPLGPLSAASEDGQHHKPNVERILQKHQRDLEWSDIVLRDAKSLAAEREAARQRKERMIGQQRNTLDRQVDARRSDAALRKQREVEEMRELMRKQEEDELIEKKKLAELRHREMEKLKQAQEFAARAAAEQARRREEEKRAEKAVQLQQQKDETLRKEEEHKRRARAQEQIRIFVVENESLMRQKREMESAARAREDSLGGKQVSVLPTGEGGRDPDPHFREKQELLLAKRRVAEQAYLEKVQKRQREIEEREKKDEQTHELLLRKDHEKKQQEKEKHLVQKHQYYADLARQVEQKKQSEQQSREQDKIARQEIEMCVRCGDAEEQKFQDMMRVMRGRNLQFLKLQMEAQKRLRESFDVCPKLV